MGRPKGSKNKPKPLAPEVLAAMEHAKAAGFVYVPEAPPAPAGKPPSDFREWLEIVRIHGKRKGELIPFEPFEEQEEIIDAYFENPDNLLVLKSRRIGISLTMVAIFHHEWLTSPHAIQIMHLANRKPVAQELMRYHRTFLETLPREMRPKLTTDQKTTITREGGATIVVDTARTSDSIRGFGPHLLHIAEMAFCKGPEELRGAAFASVPTEEGGRIVLESTANYRGDVIHQEMIAAESGTAEVAWKTFFFPWHRHESYRLPVPSTFVRTPEEESLAARYDLADAQLVFRRSRIAQMGAGKFRREFPFTVDDAYSSAIGAWFRPDEVAGLAILPIALSGTTIIEPYDPREVYVLAGDAGAGTGGDFTTGVLLNARTRRPAAIYRSNTDAPDVSADAIWHLSTTYGNALTLVERNVWGIPILNALRKLRANLYQEVDHEFDGQKPGTNPHDFVTTNKTRTEVLEGFRSEVLSGAISAIDSVCWDELGRARVDEKGDIVFPRTKDGHGDVLYSWALALRCSRHVSIPTAPPNPITERRRAAEAERVIRNHVPAGRY